VHKYSKALNVDVKIQLLENKTLKLSIIDDGVGFDINAGKKGIGLSNIKERTNSLKGNLDIRSGIGKGTEIIVMFEIAR
jgi:signal transduction histidine kinase